MTVFTIVVISGLVLRLTSIANSCYTLHPTTGPQSFRQFHPDHPFFISDFYHSYNRQETSALCTQFGMTDQLSYAQLNVIKELCLGRWMRESTNPDPAYNNYWYIYPGEEASADSYDRHHAINSYHTNCPLTAHSSFYKARVICYRPPSQATESPLTNTTQSSNGSVVIESSSNKLLMTSLFFKFNLVIVTHFVKL